MPQTIKPLGLIHKPGVGPNNRFDFKNKGNNRANEEAAGVGIVTKQNATKDVPVGGEYMNIKKLHLGQGKPKKMGENFKSALNDICKKNAINMQVTGIGSILGFHIGKGTIVRPPYYNPNDLNILKLIHLEKF